MSENENRDETTQTDILPEGEQEPLFTKAEIISDVKGFIKAYRSGKVKLQPPYSKKFEEDPLLEIKYMAVGLTRNPDSEKETEKLRENISKMIDICVGIIDVTPEERWKIVCKLYHLVTRLTSFNLLEGRYDEFDAEVKLNSFDKRLGDLEATVDGYVEHLRKDLNL